MFDTLLKKTHSMKPPSLIIIFLCISLLSSWILAKDGTSFSKDSIMETSLDKAVCEAFKSTQRTTSDDTSVEAKVEESEELWRNLFKNVDEEEFAELMSKVTTFQLNMMTDGPSQEALNYAYEFANSSSSSTGKNQTYSEWSAAAEEECGIKNSDFVKEIKRLQVYHPDFIAGDLEKHPVTRRLLSTRSGRSVLKEHSKRRLSLSSPIRALTILLGIFTVFQGLGDYMTNVLNNANEKIETEDEGIRKWLYQIAASSVIAKGVEFFQKTKKDAAPFIQKIVLVFSVLKFIEAIGGVEAIQDIIKNINSLPIVQRLRKSFQKTRFYKYIGGPIIKFFTRNYKETKAWMEKMAAEADKEANLTSEEQEKLLADVPRDILKNLSSDQKRKIAIERKKNNYKPSSNQQSRLATMELDNEVANSDDVGIEEYLDEDDRARAAFEAKAKAKAKDKLRESQKLLAGVTPEKLEKLSPDQREKALYQMKKAQDLLKAEEEKIDKKLKPKRKDGHSALADRWTEKAEEVRQSREGQADLFSSGDWVGGGVEFDSDATDVSVKEKEPALELLGHVIVR